MPSAPPTAGPRFVIVGAERALARVPSARASQASIHSKVARQVPQPADRVRVSSGSRCIPFQNESIVVVIDAEGDPSRPPKSLPAHAVSPPRYGRPSRTAAYRPDRATDRSASHHRTRRIPPGWPRLDPKNRMPRPFAAAESATGANFWTLL